MRKLLVLTLFVISTITAFAQNTEKGGASYYADKFNGKPTASGERFDNNQLTAAHKSLPFGTMVEVTNLNNNKTVVVRINDRGPFISGRIIDLSKKGAKQLGYLESGVTQVQIRVLNETSSNTNIPSSIESQDQNSRIDARSSIYKITTEQVFDRGYGVQVASLTKATNLMQMCSDLETKTNLKFYVMIKENDGANSFHVCVGDFKAMEEARVLCQQLRPTFDNCFVVDYRQ